MFRRSSRSIGRWLERQQERFKGSPRRQEIEYAFLFVATFISETVLSIDTIVTADRLWYFAGPTTLLFEFLSYAVLFAILSEDRKRSWPRFLSAALGATAGAMVATATF